MNENGFSFEIIEQIALVCESGKCTLELNRVRFCGKPSQIDLRKWILKDGEKTPAKGLSLSYKELHCLRETLEKLGY